MLEINLIDSTYSNEESFELLYELLDAKITLLGKKIHSNTERGLPTAHYEGRRQKLVDQRDGLKDLLAGFADDSLAINCKVTVK